MFDHDKLDAYRLAIEFVAWAKEHIAEGNGKRSVPDRVRFLEIARGSAFECAACLDVLMARGMLERTTADRGKAILVRVVSTVTKLIAGLESRTSTSTRTSTTKMW